MKIVNDQTLIPIGLAVTLIGSVAMWISSVRSDLASHSEQLVALSRNHDAHIKLIMEINSRLSRIEWSLETKKGK